MSKDFDQLAAVLKSCGIVASHYDAKMMAENINEGVKKNDSYYQSAYKRIMGSSGWCERKEALPDTDSNITSHIHRDPLIENVPLEPEKGVITNLSDCEMSIISPSEGNPITQPIEQAGEPAQAAICDEIAEAQDIAESILREKEVESPSPRAIESPEQKVDIEIISVKAEAPASISPEPIAAASSQPAQPSSNEDMQLMVKKMAEQMMQQMMAQQAAQQQALQEQIQKQQQVIQQMNAQQAAMKEAMQKPAPQPAQQAVVQEKPKQVFAYPAREASKGSGYFREIPVDRSKPKATLSKEEEKATDITKWFNFSGGRR